MKNNNTKTKINSLYLGIFILAISEAIIAYVQSSYLNQFYDLTLIGYIFIITYVFTFVIINEYPNLIAKFNNQKTAITSLLIKIASLLVFIFCANPLLIFVAFITFTISFTLIFINFDIFLEAFTKNTETGKVRGIFFTMYNLGWLVSPFLAGQILENFGFSLLFVMDLILSACVVLLLLVTFKKFQNHFVARHFKPWHTFSEIIKRHNIKKIFYVSFILHTFYAVMLIYTPIYLNQIIGLSWGQIGLIFTIMLLPFVILQFPAGYIADKYLGEKEILITGLLIMALVSLIIFFIQGSSILIWALILFFSRVGASLVEIMRETYFFKKVDVQNIELINALRSTAPLSYILAPFLVSIILVFLPLNYIFLILGLIILTALWPALTLKDTK